MRTSYIVYFASAAALTSAQSASSTTLRIAPAATTVPADQTDAKVPLLDTEVVQVTDEVITDLLSNNETAEYADLFAFADSNVKTDAAQRRSLLRQSSNCKTAPGDLLWPSKPVWNVFDLLLGGALNEVVPLASVCYPKSEFNNYDKAKCEAVNAGWATESPHYNDPASAMWPLYTGMTCMPNTNATNSDTCTLGGYSSYSIKVSNVAQVQLAVNLARSLNLRLVIKNTGHDYNGRSTGKGALSLWTHNLKDIIYIKNYKDSYYSGPVFQVGAGVQGNELMAAADKHGVSAVAGICPTVGVFGGYSTGGGHSPLMQLFGMGADQIVSLNVVTASGRFITVSPKINPDLYWAMLGGGGGTFGIITSAVVKVHPKIPVTTSVFSFSSSQNVSEETFWQGVRAFWDEMPKYNAAKTYSYFSIMNLANIGAAGYTFSMLPFFATNKTIAEFETLTKPFFDKLTALGIPYQIENKYYDSVYPAYQATFAPLDQHIGSIAATPANRLLPKGNWEDNELSNTTFAAVKHIVDNTVVTMMYHQAPNSPANIINSVNPAFRNEAAQLIAVNNILDTSPTGLAAAADFVTNTIMKPLRDATPNGGSYANEADIAEPNWQQSFWGANYPRLVELKKLWDPTGLFYVYRGVNSESWVVEDGDRGVQTQDGKLCRV
ncbi:FAD binding domain-containing protein [Byssothecium circinans]|uniref:FAD binding domain-containing protein n=1 Tax=Byssothecium circinans TaxID=147558 RepID=A0A6A5TW47_9PLEO|nr:FAD binding domain-containing protein [Byssothecium circinans]